MENNNFTTSIEVSNSPQEVFASLSEVSKWWSKDFEGDSRNLQDEFIIDHPGQHYSKQRLVEVIANRKMVWYVTESKLAWLQIDNNEWTDTRMIFEISSADGQTTLHFVHEGLTPDKECYAMCEKGWTIIIKNWLYYLITHGTESPEMTKAAQMRNQLLAERNKTKQGLQ